VVDCDRVGAAQAAPYRKRIWRRLLDEHGVDVGETTVGDHVRKRRRELGLAVSDVFISQVPRARTHGG
jgi:hypothetical protein